MVPTVLYQVWVVVFPVDSVSVEHQGPSLLQAGGHPDGELGLVSGNAPGLRYRHNVAPRVQRVTVPTWRWNTWWQIRTTIRWTSLYPIPSAPQMSRWTQSRISRACQTNIFFGIPMASRTPNQEFHWNRTLWWSKSLQLHTKIKEKTFNNLIMFFVCESTPISPNVR